MQSDFEPENLERAKWYLTRKLKLAEEREKLVLEITKKRSFWYWLRMRILGF